MRTRLRTLLLLAVAYGVPWTPCQSALAGVRAETEPVDAVDIRTRLDEARAEFDQVNAQLRQDLLELLDGAEQTARENGNKPRLDRIKEQLAAFEKDGTLPRVVGTTSYLYKVRESRRVLEGVYADVISELTQAGDDTQADQIEVELHELRRAVVGNRLQAGEALLRGEMLYSQDGRYMLVFQLDGNLAVRRVADGRALWTSGTGGRAQQCRMQFDGNLVIRDRRNKALWNARVSGQNGAILYVQNDGNVVIKRPGRRPAWATGTNER